MRLTTLSELDLAGLALSGQGPAWDELVRRHSRRVWLSLLAHGVPPDAADDLVQETWVRLVQRQREGRLRVLVLPGLAIAQARWLAREAGRVAARRHALLSARAGGGEDAEPAVDGAFDPEVLALGRERLAAVQAVLAAEPPRVRRVFLAVYGPEALAHQQVAIEMGLSLQRVRQILCEVRARMRAALANSQEGNLP